MSNRWAVLALIMAAQTMATVGPLGIPSIAPLIRAGLGLSVTQAGSFLSAYYVGPVLMSLPPARQTVFLAFLVLYLRDVVHIALVAAAKYLVAAQVGGAIARIGFGLLSDRLFGGRRRIVLAIAGLGSIACALVLSTIAPGTGPWLLAPLAVGIGVFGVGWNGVQHTLMAELAGLGRAGGEHGGSATLAHPGAGEGDGDLVTGPCFWAPSPSR